MYRSLHQGTHCSDISIQISFSSLLPPPQTKNTTMTKKMDVTEFDGVTSRTKYEVEVDLGDVLAFAFYAVAVYVVMQGRRGTAFAVVGILLLLGWR